MATTNLNVEIIFLILPQYHTYVKNTDHPLISRKPPCHAKTRTRSSWTLVSLIRFQTASSIYWKLSCPYYLHCKPLKFQSEILTCVRLVCLFACFNLRFTCYSFWIKRSILSSQDWIHNIGSRITKYKNENLAVVLQLNTEHMSGLQKRKHLGWQCTYFFYCMTWIKWH